MIPYLVRAEIFVDLGKELLHRRGSARAAGSRLRIDDDRRRLYQVAPYQRQQREQRAGRKASGSRDQPCLAKFLAVELAKSVHRLLEKLRRRMIDSVGCAELRGILEPEIRRQ